MSRTESTSALPEPTSPARASRGRPRPPGALLGGMRIRKKLIILHTSFSLGLAVILLIALRPAIIEVVEQAEANEALLLTRLALRGSPDELMGGLPEGVRIETGTAEELRLPQATGAEAGANPGRPVALFVRAEPPAAVALDARTGRFVRVSVRIPEARRAVLQLYGLTAAALLAVYGLVAAALELFVLPQNVYSPIRRLLDADAAVQAGQQDRELIPEEVMPADELGEIMRSRNESIVALRRGERALGEALAELETVATDLKRKNHLLQMAQRNLADADRLASLGIMSAGLAHELNTPLTVLKGLVEKLNEDPARGIDRDHAALMLRVVGRLERLGESLLDFARVRPPQTRPVEVRPLVEEAATLVRLDRDAHDVEFVIAAPKGLVLECDGDRMVQVLVNLLRNATDAMRSRSANGARGRVEVRAEGLTRDGSDWVCITVTDNGPGLDPEIVPRLFEPFASTRMDSQGTGLGLAVAEGIVREHGGLILARNRADARGAVFEVMLPRRAAGYAGTGPEPEPPRDA